VFNKTVEQKTMSKAIKIDVTFPSGKTATFKSIRAVSRMLSGLGTQSGGFRKSISRRAAVTGVVRNNQVTDAVHWTQLHTA
jgi:hypothetical protein